MGNTTQPTNCRLDPLVDRHFEKVPTDKNFFHDDIKFCDPDAPTVINKFADPFKQRPSIPEENNEINLLLLGETGVGKSTFINSFGNYFKYPRFKAAQEGDLKILIPVKVGKKLYGTEDANECHTSGAAQTQYVKVYMIPVNIGGTALKLRLIDTPGVGDPRGIDKDNENCDNILAYLATLKRLHGICFIMKANNTRFTQFFEYCFKQILTRLDKSASENIIFITTYSTTSGYTAGETKTSCLDNLVARIRSIPPHVEIPLNDDNTFALDNGAFKPLLQMKSGMTFANHESASFEMSWNTSAKECFRLLTYIIGDETRSPLKPHEVENTTSINEVRFLIEQLANPLAEITDLIQDNIRALDRHKLEIQKGNQDVNKLRQKLFIPCVDLQVKELDQPVTVCTDAKCTEVVRVNNTTKWHYRQRCHNPCHLIGVPKEMIGDHRLAECAAMTGEDCSKCGCHYKVHMHIYKETEKIDVHKQDKNVKKEIKTKQDAMASINQLIKTLDCRKREYQEEAGFISEKMAIFSYFLQENAITPYNDAYKEYMEYLIKNEKSLGRMADQAKIEKYNKLLQKHEHLQETFKKSQQIHSQSFSVAIMLNPSNIKTYINELYDLKHMGAKIQELIHKSSACRNKEIQKNFSCVVTDPVSLNSADYLENAMPVVEDDVAQPKPMEQQAAVDVPKVEEKQKKPKAAEFQRYRGDRFYGEFPYDDYYEDRSRPRRWRELEGRRPWYRGRDEFYDDDDRYSTKYDDWSHRRRKQDAYEKSRPRSREDDDSDDSLELDGRQDKYDGRNVEEQIHLIEDEIFILRKLCQNIRRNVTDWSRRRPEQDLDGDNCSIKSQHRRPDKFDGRRDSYSKKTVPKYREEFDYDHSISGHSSITLRPSLRRRDHPVCRCSSNYSQKYRYHEYLEDRSTSEDFSPERPSSRRQSKFENSPLSSSTKLDDLENMSSTETKGREKSGKQRNIKKNLRETEKQEKSTSKEQSKIARPSAPEKFTTVGNNVSFPTSGSQKVTGLYGFDSLLNLGGSIKRSNSAPSIDFEFLTYKNAKKKNE